MSRCVVMVVVVTSACGRFHFDDTRDAGVGDARDPDGGGASACSAAPRPDTSSPDQIIGTGTFDSCAAVDLQAAVDAGGVIAFACGGPIGIQLPTEVTITRDVVIDGGGLVSLSARTGGRVMTIAAPGGRVTLLDLALVNGSPPAAGGAIAVNTGNLLVIGSRFSDNVSVAEGGAIYVVPTAGSLAIYDATFDGNTGTSGGAVWAADDLTIVRSTFTANAAADASQGFGGAVSHEGTGDLTVCGATFDSNNATNLGGALHRVCTDGGCTDTIERTRITNNRAQIAGGAYVQDSLLSVRQTSIATNTASAGDVGGLWYVGTRGFTGEQLSVLDNSALAGLGAGLRVGNAPGTLSFATIARNACGNATCDSAGLQATAALAVRASLIVDNTSAGTGVTCRDAASDGTGTFQWPAEQDTPCAASAQFTDPQLGATLTRTGPRGMFPVAPPGQGSPAHAVITDCPAEDQVGDSRPVPCTAGAVEP